MLSSLSLCSLVLSLYLLPLDGLRVIESKKVRSDKGRECVDASLISYIIFGQKIDDGRLSDADVCYQVEHWAWYVYVYRYAFGHAYASLCVHVCVLYAPKHISNNTTNNTGSKLYLFVWLVSSEYALELTSNHFDPNNNMR